MVDDMKKQMRRFEHLIGFKGRLDETSRESMKRLIEAFDSRYKNDIQNSIRLHRLEFFHDLVEGRRKRKEKMDKEVEASVKRRKRKKSEDKEEDDRQEETPKEPTKTDQAESDEVLSIRATDVDDWKDLMTLSKIYYAHENPRSEGLKWKRRITKKKNIQEFSDKDFIEWRVTQNFRLRGLEEWAQRRSDARKLAEQLHIDTDEIELDDDVKELEELYEMFDPSGRKYEKKERTVKPKKVLSTADRPFKFKDEGIEDWTESYSDDSDYSDEHFAEETDDFEDESERKIAEREEEQDLTTEEEEDITEMFSKYPEFIRYREEIFKRMEKAETTEDWFKIYFESCPTPDEMEITGKEVPLITVTKDEEESEVERDKIGQKAVKLDTLKETDEEAESESEIEKEDLIKEIDSEIKPIFEKMIPILEEESREQKELDLIKEIDSEIKPIFEKMIPILEEEAREQKELLESKMAPEEQKQTESKSISEEGIHFPQQETSEQRDKLKTEVGIVEDMDPEIKSISGTEISVPKEETVGEKEQLEFQTGIVEQEQQPETESVAENLIQIPEETVNKSEQSDFQMRTGEREEKTEEESGSEGVIQISEERTIGKAKQLESQAVMGEVPEPEKEAKSVSKVVIQNPEEETVEKTEQLKSLRGIDEKEIKPEKEMIAKETILTPEEIIEKTEELESQKGEEPEPETKSVTGEVIQISEEPIGERGQSETIKRVDEEKIKSEKEMTANKTIRKSEETIELKEQGEVENEIVEPPIESMAEEEAQTLTEPRQNIDLEPEVKDGEETKIEAVLKEGESDSIKDIRTEVHKDIEKHEEASDDIKTDSTLRGLEKKQKGENTSNKKEESLEQDTTSSIKEKSEGHAVQKLVDKEDEIADTDDEPLTESSKPETEQSTSESENQERNGYETDPMKEKEIKEIIKACSKRHRRRKLKRSASYSVLENENATEPATEPSYIVRRPDSRESVLLCAACSRSITDILSQEYSDEEYCSSDTETDSKTEEDAEDKKRTELE